MTAGVAAAYDLGAQAWAGGPARIYDRLAELVVGSVPDLGSGRVLDVGAGTGAASRALRAAGASVIAMDLAAGMLRVGCADRPASVVADACRLPFPAGRFAAVVGAFSFTHLDDPAVGLAEAARVVRTGGPVVASGFPAGERHPLKDLVGQQLRACGWVPPPWYEGVGASGGGLAEAARRTGFRSVHEQVVTADLGLVPADALIEWRLGMAHVAGFVAGLPAPDRQALRAAIAADLPPRYPLVLPVLLVTART